MMAQEETKQQGTPQDGAATDDMMASEVAAETTGGGGGAGTAGSVGTGADARLAAAQQEITDLKAKLIRWQADLQNVQRRAAREMLEARQNADADFAKGMLHVLDHFDMALGVDPAKVDAKSVLDGVKITYDELKKVLASRGIESYDPTGKPFDPHQHEAVMQEASDTYPPMTVVQTFQQGYRIGDRILRPAKVKVSK
jgi:molecular chaperone GrpE